MMGPLNYERRRLQDVADDLRKCTCAGEDFDAEEARRKIQDVDGDLGHHYCGDHCGCDTACYREHVEDSFGTGQGTPAGNRVEALEKVARAARHGSRDDVRKALDELEWHGGIDDRAILPSGPTLFDGAS